VTALRLPADSTYPSQLITGGGRLLGWALLETTGTAAATAVIRDGTAATGNLLVPISLSAGQSTRDWESIHPMPYYQGIFLQNVTGAWEGSIWVQPCDPDEDWHIGVVLTIPITHQSISGT
jgi:hypothetical protein